MGRQHVGPKRSPLYDAAGVVRAGQVIVQDRPGFRLVGAMTYEGQVAGVQDDVPSQRARSAVVRRLKSLSLTQLEVRRREIADALAGGGRPGVLERRRLGVGRGDRRGSGGHRGRGRLRAAGADALRPLPVLPAAARGVLRPAGGPPAIAAGRDRARRRLRRPPARQAPTGCPPRGRPRGSISPGSRAPGRCRRRSPGRRRRCCPIGDLVWFRHAKSGEPFEHTDVVHLLEGERFVDTVPTYRGHGCVF